MKCLHFLWASLIPDIYMATCFLIQLVKASIAIKLSGNTVPLYFLIFIFSLTPSGLTEKKNFYVLALELQRRLFQALQSTHKRKEHVRLGKNPTDWAPLPPPSDVVLHKCILHQIKFHCVPNHGVTSF